MEYKSDLCTIYSKHLFKWFEWIVSFTCLINDSIKPTLKIVPHNLAVSSNLVTHGTLFNGEYYYIGVWKVTRLTGRPRDDKKKEQDQPHSSQF